MPDIASALSITHAPIDVLRNVAYKLHMVLIERTAEFAAWLSAVRDARAKAKIALRIDRLALRNAGDAKPIGGGLSEMRIDYGPGYRVYFGRRGDAIIILLCGGTKKTQHADIDHAKRLFADWKSS